MYGSLPIAYCLLSIVYCLLPIVYCLLPIAYCLLPIAYCLFNVLLKTKEPPGGGGCTNQIPLTIKPYPMKIQI